MWRGSNELGFQTKMKERVEVTRKIEKKSRERRRSRRRRKSTTSLPRDIISEILSKLPFKSIVRFRCVSKLWSSITTDPYFHKSLQTTRLLVVGFRKHDGFFVLSIPQENLQNRNESFDSFTYNSYSCSQPIGSYRMTHVSYQRFFTIETESIHGLMIGFITPKIPIVWKPSMRKLLPLPKPFKTWLIDFRIFLGYDPIEGKHKVVYLPKMRFDQALGECDVLTLGSRSAQEPWRTLEKIPNHFPLTDGNTNTGYSHARCINGVVYYHAKLGSKLDSKIVMMSFDVRSEKFHVITLPRGYKSWRRTISYHGKFACVGYDNQCKTISMFLLEDATKHEWSMHQFSASSSRTVSGFESFRPND
ncbi:unnamed protein product [Microthlaspi erraticum]|uniref:F-box domain-containing protein n=1 Tax=Microthlaspi erraticum TaxID=1685480 RepID=A0A6D2JWC4_9BRAS|nr:unnamed protein product [Microthlaspi erraticum]